MEPKQAPLEQMAQGTWKIKTDQELWGRGGPQSLAWLTKVPGSRAKLSQRPAHLSPLTLLLPQTTLAATGPLCLTLQVLATRA